MINEFSRTELLLGEEGIEKLRKAKVMVFGVGGVGSHCIEALARCGVGELMLIDNDTVSLYLSNTFTKPRVFFYCCLCHLNTRPPLQNDS